MNRIGTDPHWLRTLLLVGANDHRPDAELLDRFARYAEQAAFEAILRRHGPLVWGVCRRTLSNPADADDAFQATFLVLVQKAGRVTHGGQLGPWLYGVAVRVSRRLRDKARRVPTCDPELAALLPDRERADPDADWLGNLDLELHALPAKFRDPMVLCELQGLSRAAAAERLRLREGTLSSRLARGRILLRQRLLKYGTLLPAGGLVALLGTASTAPARLLGKTAESVAQVTAAGGILTGVVPASVARLTLEVTGMGLFKLKIATAMAVTLATLTLGLVAADGPKVTADKPAAEVPKAAAVAEKPAVIEGDLAALQGVWEMHGVHDAGVVVNKPVQWGKCVVRGDVAWMVGPDVNLAYRLRLHLTPDRNPKCIDIVSDSAISRFRDGDAGGTSEGIYRLTAEGWELAVGIGGNFRPAEFETNRHQGVESLSFRRPKADISPVDVNAAEARKALSGRWTVARYDHPNFDRTSTIDLSGGLAEITPEYLFVQHPDASGGLASGRVDHVVQLMLEIKHGKGFAWHAAEYTLDPSKKPKWIDLKSGGGQTSDGKPIDAGGFGIYDLTGGTLRISYRLSVPRLLRTLEFNVGSERPPGGGQSKLPKPACAMLELKRVTTP